MPPGRPARVVFLIPLAELLGGSERALHDYLMRVDRARIAAHVVFLAEGTQPDRLRSAGFGVHVIPSGRLRQVRAFLRATRAIGRLLRRLEPDLLVSWDAQPHLYASAARLARRVPAIWWQHGIPDPRAPVTRIATALPVREVGAWSQASARAQGRVAPRRTTFVVHPGVAPPPAEADPRTRAELGLPAGRFVVGVVGRLIPWKRQDAVIRAVSAARRQGIDAHLVVVGGDAYGLAPEYPALLRRTAAEEEVADAVTFVGQVASPWPFLRAMDVSVNASLAEPFGIALTESMAVGTPVVAMDGGGPREIITSGVDGLLVAPGDDAALTAAIVRLARDPAYTARLAEAALQTFIARFHVDAFVEGLTRELERLARA